MNREIKFRAWIDIHKRMAFGPSVGAVSPSWILALCSGQPEIPLMQYTGLKDKNGKEIYEGDIVRWGLGFCGHFDEESYHRYAVVEIKPDIQFKIIYYIDRKTEEKKPNDNHIFHYARFMYNTSKHVEIIGNVHENPEML